MDTGEPMTPWAASFTQNLEQVGKANRITPSTAHHDKRVSRPPALSRQALPSSLQSSSGPAYVRATWSSAQPPPRRPQAIYQRSPNILPIFAEGPTISSSMPNDLPAHRIAPLPTIVVSSPPSHRATARDNPLVLAAINNSQSMSLRKWLHWIVSLREVHQYQSVHHVQAKDTESPTASAAWVLRNLQELWRMYKPGRVMLPTTEVEDVVRTIYSILQQQKLEMEDRFEQIQDKSRTMTSLEFLEWLSVNYKVAGRRLELPRAGMFYNPDSLTDQQKEIGKAIHFYSMDTSDIMYDSSATNVFADVLISALKSHQINVAPRPAVTAQREPETRCDYQIYYDAWMSYKRRKQAAKKAAEGPAGTAPATSSSRAFGDRLLFYHALPHSKE